MSARTHVLPLLVSATLVAPVAPVRAAPTAAPDDATLRIALVTFKGNARVTRARGGAASIRGYAPDCNVAGVDDGTPYLEPCYFWFETGSAPLSSDCSGTWIHTSHLTFTIASTGRTVMLSYDPTVTTSAEGEAVGNGVNALGISKVHFDIVSLCAVPSDDEGADGNLVGYATGPL